MSPLGVVAADPTESRERTKGVAKLFLFRAAAPPEQDPLDGVFFPRTSSEGAPVTRLRLNPTEGVISSRFHES